MNRLAQAMNFNLGVGTNPEIGLYKLRQKDNVMESLLAVKLSTNARGIFYAVLFHLLNGIGKLLSTILYVDS